MICLYESVCVSHCDANILIVILCWFRRSEDQTDQESLPKTISNWEIEIIWFQVSPLYCAHSSHTHFRDMIGYIMSVLSFYEQLSHKKTPEGGDTEFKLIQSGKIRVPFTKTQTDKRYLDSRRGNVCIFVRLTLHQRIIVVVVGRQRVISFLIVWQRCSKNVDSKKVSDFPF